MVKARAAVMTGIGGPDVLEIREITLRWPARDCDVLVRVEAAGVNPADGFFRALGTYVEADEPVVLGSDGAGVVAEVGPGVARVRPGDRVCFCNGGIGGVPGTYCEYAVVPEDLLISVPEDVDILAAAAFPLVTITAWEAMVERAGLGPGENVLVHGGAGGTGQMAIQVARLRGAQVAATVSNTDKADIVSRLGAARPILYRSEDFVGAAMEFTAGRGLDVALDNVGPECMAATYSAMAPYGRIVTLMGTVADDEDLNAYNRNLTIHNVMMLTPMWFGLESHQVRQAEIVRNLIGNLCDGSIAVDVNAVFGLDEVVAAHRLLDAGGLTGKIVLDVSR